MTHYHAFLQLAASFLKRICDFFNRRNYLKLPQHFRHKYAFVLLSWFKCFFLTLSWWHGYVYQLYTFIFRVILTSLCFSGISGNDGWVIIPFRLYKCKFLLMWYIFSCINCMYILLNNFWIYSILLFLILFHVVDQNSLSANFIKIITDFYFLKTSIKSFILI